jgi:type I restriction enzyme S subunit
LSESVNSDSTATLLSLASTGVVAPREEFAGLGRQMPAEGTIERYWLASPGNLVVNPMWLTGGGIGVSNVHGAVSPDYRVYRLGPELDPRFAHHLLRSQPYRDQYKLYTRAETTFDRRVSKVDFHAMPILVPPLDEQRRIADFLDAETARIDSLVLKKQTVIALLEERVRTIINQVTPGSVVLGTDGRPTGITGLDCVRLGTIATVHGGFTMDEGRETGPDAVTMPYVRVANVLDGSLALEDVKEVTLPRVMAERYTLRRGDVLMTEGGDPDKLGRGTVWPGGFGPCLHQNAIFAVRPDSRLLPEYLALVTRTQYARAYFEVTSSKATGIAHTSSTKITSFRVPLPPVGEQRRIAAAISEAVARINALREPVLEQVKLFAERRQALITAAVTGGITV